MAPRPPPNAPAPVSAASTAGSRATDPDTGERFPVDDPGLLLWVHCAEIDSYLNIARRSGFPLTDAHADAYVDEQREAARLVGLDPATVPADTAQLARYFDRVRPELAATPEALDVVRFLKAPPVPKPLLPVRLAVWGTVAGTAFAALPPYAHELYGKAASVAGRDGPAAARRRRGRCGRYPRPCAGSCRPATSSRRSAGSAPARTRRCAGCPPPDPICPDALSPPRPCPAILGLGKHR